MERLSKTLRDSEEESHRQGEVRGYKREMVKQKETALSCGQKHNSLILCWRETGCETRAKAKRETCREGGRESNRERAEVVGEAEAEADNMLSLWKTDRKAVIRELLERRRESHYTENYVARADENLVSGDQNKEIIKDERSAHWQRGHSLQQRHYAWTSIE